MVFKDLIHFIIWPKWPQPRVLTPDPGDMDFTIVVDGFIDIIHVTMHSSFHICGNREEDL